MKHTKLMAIGTLLLLGVGGATAQSLGDYAREARKNKTEPSSASHHYDNDNLPTGQALSVVGPPPASDDKAEQRTATASSAPAAKAPADAERQKASDELKQKIEKQKEKIDSLNQGLDLDQRELRLRAAAMYSNPGIAVRTTQWEKDEQQYRGDIDAKQKALGAARQELDELQEQARKAGIEEKSIEEKDKDKDKDRDNSKNNDKDKDKDK